MLKAYRFLGKENLFFKNKLGPQLNHTYQKRNKQSWFMGIAVIMGSWSPLVNY
jgi:hypothetical protein